jgi:hypothetical protein
MIVFSPLDKQRLRKPPGDMSALKESGNQWHRLMSGKGN